MDLPCLCRPFNMLYCTLLYLFYAILVCFLHIGRLLDGSSVFHVILLGLLKIKKMVKTDSVIEYRQRQICWLPCVRILKNRNRIVFSKSSFLTTYCAGHQSPDWYQDPAMETENGTPAADVVHPLQTAAFLVNSTITNQVNVNFTASQPDIQMTNLYYHAEPKEHLALEIMLPSLGGAPVLGLKLEGRNTELVPSNSKTLSLRNAILVQESAKVPLK